MPAVPQDPDKRLAKMPRTAGHHHSHRVSVPSAGIAYREASLGNQHSASARNVAGPLAISRCARMKAPIVRVAPEASVWALSLEGAMGLKSRAWYDRFVIRNIIDLYAIARSFLLLRGH